MLTIELEYAYKLVRTLPTSHIANLVDRLTPILHLDFIQILPSELSLQILSYLPPKSLLDASLASKHWRRYALEPTLWKNLFKCQGWEADDGEVRKFEQEMQIRANDEGQQRQEEQQRLARARRKAQKASASQDTHMGGMPWSQQASDMDSDSDTPAFSRPMGNAEAQRLLAGYPSAGLSDEDEMYPSPQGGIPSSQTLAEPPLTISPTLTTPGYLSSPPRLNWAFLFKNRRKLDDNWYHNKCTPFQIPHPNYPHEGHRECIYTIQYSPKYLCSGSRDKSIRIWNIKTRRMVGEPLVGHSGSVLCLQFDESPDQDVIISGSSDASVIVWRFSTGERLQVIKKAHDESVLNLRFSKKWLVTCSKDKLIKIWNRVPLETQDPEYPWNSKLVFGPNRAPQNHPHHPNYQPTWQVEDPQTNGGLNLQNPFSQNATQFSSRQTRRVQPKTIPVYTACNALQGHVAAVNAIQLIGNEIVSASGDRVIKLWNLVTGLCEKTFVGHQKGIACIQFDGNTIVSGSSDHTIRVFDRETQAEIATLRGHTALVRTVQATKNKIVSGSYDESVRIWLRDEESGEWSPGPVLHQAHNPRLTSNNLPNHHNQTQQQQDALQHFANQTANGIVPTVQMHQIQHVGQPGNQSALIGSLAAANLLPPTNQTFLAPNNPTAAPTTVNPPPPQPPAQVVPNSLTGPPPPTAAPVPAQAQQPPVQQQPPAQQPAPQQPPAQQPVPVLAAATAQIVAHGGAPAAATPGAHRVFKLQFDARWIICCSQDCRIVGWDYAADEEGIIEASRFFLGG